MTYLLTNRFSEVQELALRIVKDFVDRVGAKIETKQIAQFLLIVSEIKISKGCYEMWRDCLGQFMIVMGPRKFFNELPLRLT